MNRSKMPVDNSTFDIRVIDYLSVQTAQVNGTVPNKIMIVDRTVTSIEWCKIGKYY